MTGVRIRLGVCAVLCALALPLPAAAWGVAGHTAVARAATRACDDLPAWFRGSADALSSLAVGPDRWRDLERRAPGLATLRAEHFFDLDAWGERVPADRQAFVRRAAERGVDPWDVGFLPYAVAEDYGELLAAFRDARVGRPGAQAAAVAAAGRLAHWAGDAAVPLHATRHHHGWVGPNPRGFTRGGAIHEWFDRILVLQVDLAAVAPGSAVRRTFRDVHEATGELLRESLALVPAVYEAERGSRAGDPGAALALVRQRLDAGATFLARLWRTAWVRSGGH